MLMQFPKYQLCFYYGWASLVPYTICINATLGMRYNFLRIFYYNIILFLPYFSKWKNIQISNSSFCIDILFKESFYVIKKVLLIKRQGHQGSLYLCCRTRFGRGVNHMALIAFMAIITYYYILLYIIIYYYVLLYNII